MNLQALQKDLALSSAGKLMLLHGQQPLTALMFESVDKQPMASASIAQVSPGLAFHISLQEWRCVSNLRIRDNIEAYWRGDCQCSFDIGQCIAWPSLLEA